MIYLSKTYPTINAIFCICLLIRLHAYGEISHPNDNTPSSNQSNTDKTDTLTVRYTFDSGITVHFDSLRVITNSLDQFQQYNPIYKTSSFLKHQGNLGSAYQKMSLSIPDLTESINIGFHNYNHYELTPDSIKYYHLKHPFTELYYVNGAKNEQLFNIRHTQNITEGINVGLKYQRLLSDGFYMRQRSNDWNFAFFSWYRSKNGRYNIVNNFIMNSLKVEENGGISKDSLFENSSETNKKTIDIALDSAQTRWKGYGIFIKQSLALGKKMIINSPDSGNVDNSAHSLTDTINPDTTSKMHTGFNGFPDSMVFIPTSKISHTFYYKRKSFVYDDALPASGFYDSIYFDSLKTLDSTIITSIENQIAWNTIPEKGHPTTGIRIKHQLFTYRQNDFDSLLHNISVGANVISTGQKKYQWKISGAYSLYGYNQNDFYSALSISRKISGAKSEADTSNEGIKQAARINFSITIQKKEPAIIYNRYSSNHLVWDNEFNKTDLIYGKLEYNLNRRKFLLGASFAHISNIIYLDTLLVPKQEESSINHIQVFLKKNFQLGKLNINNKLIYQYITGKDYGTSGQTVIRVPEFISIHSIYFETSLFKKVMVAQVGIDIFYNTAYYADAYVPAINQFYLQNNKAIGNYPYFDFFMNFKLKKVRTFVKMEHLNSGMMGNIYYMIPHYPMPDRALKFGISWMLYD